MALQAPIDRLTHRALRAAVLEHKESEHRHHFPPALHVGLPGHSHVHHADPALAYDPGLRTDIALALLQRSLRTLPVPFVWLTRPGDLDLQDPEVWWGSAVCHAAGALDTPVSLVVVNRHGWRDPVSGVRREWRRLRRHSDRPVLP